MLLLVAVLAVGAALVARWSSTGERPVARVERATEQHEVEFAIEPPPPIAVLADEVVAGEPVADTLDPTPVPEAFTVVLRGTVSCSFGAVKLAQLSITTTQVDAPVLSAAVAADGAFEVDVTSLVVSSGDRELLVDARHPNAIAEHLVVEPQAFRDFAPGEKRVIPLEILLGRAACIVELRVLKASGVTTPVTVSMFSVSGPVLGSRIERDEKYDGSFLFYVPRGEYVLVAYVPDLRPATVRVGCDGQSRVDLGTITLDHGEKLSGRVEFRGDPLGWGYVQARLVGAPEGAPQALHWTGTSFEWSLREAFVDGKGNFEVSGLAAAEHELHVTRIEHLYGQDFASRVLIAPASNVVLEPKICRLVLEVLVGGEPKPIEFGTRSAYGKDGTKGTSSTSRHTQSGRATIWLVPGSSNEAVFDISEILGIPGEPERTFKLPDCAGGEELTMYINL